MVFRCETPRRQARKGLLAGIALSALPLLPAAGQAASTEPLLLEEIIVTAQKRLENLQTVPASVSVLSGERIARSSPTGVADYAAYMPGLAISSGGTPGQVSLALRGVAPVGPGATVGTYIDDTPLGSSANYARAAIYAALGRSHLAAPMPAPVVMPDPAPVAPPAPEPVARPGAPDLPYDLRYHLGLR